jgi:HSP20 family protein
MSFYAYAFPNRVASRWLASAGRGLGHRQLRLNVQDEGEAYTVTAPVPGLKAEDLKIHVLEDVLQIEGDTPGDDGEHLLREIPGGPFRRELRLPAPLEADKVQANIADGMLTLRLPKAESSRPKTIKVAAN